MIGLLLAGGLLIGPGSTTRVVVSAGESLQQAVDLAPSGSVVYLEPGIHRGPIRILKPLTLAGSGDARVVSPSTADAGIDIASDRVRIEGITATGGSSGIFLQDVEGISIHDVTVQGAVLHGIELSGASARITSVHIEALRHRFAHGIGVRFSYHRPKTRVAGSVVAGGWEGLVSHASRVVFEDNSVVGTTMRGIKITEMSKGEAVGNRVSEASGMGLYCGDESLCAFSSNEVEVSPGFGTQAMQGWGLVVEYRSTASSDGDLLKGEAGSQRATTHSRIVDN
jgi:nitrous oxidase accessory protein